MVTRGLIGHSVAGHKYAGVIAHSAYPSYVGVELVDFIEYLSAKNLKTQMREKIRNLSWVDPDTNAPEELAERYEFMGFSNGSHGLEWGEVLGNVNGVAALFRILSGQLSHLPDYAPELKLCHFYEAIYWINWDEYTVTVSWCEGGKQFTFPQLTGSLMKHISDAWAEENYAPTEPSDDGGYIAEANHTGQVVLSLDRCDEITAGGKESLEINEDDPEKERSRSSSFDRAKSTSPHFPLSNLPQEVSETIIRYVCDLSSSKTVSKDSIMGLMNRDWRETIQKILYRHFRLKATRDFIETTRRNFATNPDLQQYVKSVEVWFPAFQPANPGPSDICTLGQVFSFIKTTFPRVKELTLAGDARIAPKIPCFSTASETSLPVIESLKTLVTKRQWNLLRDENDFSTLLTALPKLENWLSSYCEPRVELDPFLMAEHNAVTAKSYRSVFKSCHLIPRGIKRFDLCLERDNRSENCVPDFCLGMPTDTHLCPEIGKLAPSLKQFTYAGRICQDFFQTAFESAYSPSNQLQSIDITVKNCCPLTTMPGSSDSGFQNASFVDAFKKLVLAAIRSLKNLIQVQYLRIRFIDITPHCPWPKLNPFFLLCDQKCTGIRSDEIVKEMQQVRPHVEFNEWDGTFGTYEKDGRRSIIGADPYGISLPVEKYDELSRRQHQN